MFAFTMRISQIMKETFYGRFQKIDEMAAKKGKNPKNIIGVF